ncbi:MAG: cysteine--tRNA ligase [Actinomycetota bacterium]
MMQLYDTASQRVAPLDLREPGKVSIYVCGPTVYAAPHIGHGRQVLVYDVLRRYLEWSGLDVTFVSNITDIDDAIIDRANAEDRDPADIARKCEAVWWDALERIDVRRPDHIPHATDYVEQMVELVVELIDRGLAYQTSDGVYLSVEGVPDYGLLPHVELENLREGGGDREIFGDEKRHPADFVLWKLAKPGEPFWPSPWGDGRPGWHTECVVMSLDLLGEGFDLHTGGLDLVFPHHENERAQAVALGKRFARHWMHHGFVELEGEKMSKSLGNVKNLLDLTEAYDPRAYRLLLLQSHYRSPIEVTDDTMSAAQSALGRLDSFARRTADLAGVPDPEVLDRFRALMENDLDTPGAADLMFRLVREANSALDAEDQGTAATAAAAALEIAGAFGLRLGSDDTEVPDDVRRMVDERQAARSAKDYALADELRDRIAAAGWSIEDAADGPVVVPLG